MLPRWVPCLSFSVAMGEEGKKWDIRIYLFFIFSLLLGFWEKSGTRRSGGNWIYYNFCCSSNHIIFFLSLCRWIFSALFFFGSSRNWPKRERERALTLNRLPIIYDYYGPIIEAHFSPDGLCRKVSSANGKLLHVIAAKIVWFNELFTSFTISALVLQIAAFTQWTWICWDTNTAMLTGVVSFASICYVIT